MSTVQLDDPFTGGPAGQQGIAGAARVTQAATSVAAVTPSNSTALKRGVKGLWVGGAGTVVVTMWDGSTATFSAVPAGTFLPVSPQYVNTSSTATLIVAFY